MKIWSLGLRKHCHIIPKIVLLCGRVPSWFGCVLPCPEKPRGKEPTLIKSRIGVGGWHISRLCGKRAVLGWKLANQALLCLYLHFTLWSKFKFLCPKITFHYPLEILVLFDFILWSNNFGRCLIVFFFDLKKLVIPVGPWMLRMTVIYLFLIIITFCFSDAEICFAADFSNE